MIHKIKKANSKSMALPTALLTSPRGSGDVAVSTASMPPHRTAPLSSGAASPPSALLNEKEKLRERCTTNERKEGAADDDDDDDDDEGERRKKKKKEERSKKKEEKYQRKEERRGRKKVERRKECGRVKVMIFAILLAHANPETAFFLASFIRPILLPLLFLFSPAQDCTTHPRPSRKAKKAAKNISGIPDKFLIAHRNSPLC
jgi:hypothetical protein